LLPKADVVDVKSGADDVAPNPGVGVPNNEGCADGCAGANGFAEVGFD
jgi:hypothetical protein